MSDNSMKGLVVAVWLFFGIQAFGQKMAVPHDSLVRIAYELIQAGDLESAKDILYSIIEVYPEGNKSYYWLGVCYSTDCVTQEENCALGISFLDKAIAMNRFFRTPFYHRALCKLHIKDLTGALTDIDTQIEIEASDPAFFLLRAEIYLQINDRLAACEDFQRMKGMYKTLPKEDKITQKLIAACGENPTN